MNIEEMQELQSEITRAFVNSNIPREWEQLACLSWELEKLENAFKKLGYTEDINNQFMSIKRELYKLGVVKQ